jgi:hypothetical protein
MGKHLSAEHKAKVRDAHLGKIVSQETRARMSTSLRRKRVSDETRVKIQLVATERFQPGFGQALGVANGQILNSPVAVMDQSADWLENEMGVVNLGQIDYKVLMADGVLTDQIRDGLIAWWAERVEDLDLG